MPTPSLLIVPARFKSGKMYSQIPTSGAGDFVVTRATTATRVGPDGLIASVASGIPRLDYFASGGTVGCPALLVEPSAQNVCLQSEAFNTTWTLVTGGTGLLPVITANAVVAPDGTTTADTIAFNRGAGNTSSDFSQINQIISLATSGTYTFSVYAKATTSGDVGKQFYIRAKNTLTAGTLTSSWVRYTSTETGVASGNTSVMIGSRGTFTTDNSVSVDLWGAQLETGSVATSYIPTTTASVTRNADVISVSGAVSGSIGQTEGVLYIECESNDGLDDVFFINRSVVNGILLYKNPTNSYIGRIHHSSNTITFQSASGVTGFVKIAIAYKSGDSTMYLNGSRVGTLNTNAITFGAALNTVGVNKDPFFSGAKPSRIRAAALYTTRLTNAQLALITQL